MVIDAAKGIEPQTLKLFEVCRLRSVPIITFVNKVDREGRPCFEILDEVADKLALDVCPMSWPVGMGGRVRGHTSISQAAGVARPEGDSREYFGQTRSTIHRSRRNCPKALKLRDEVELAQAGYPEFDLEAYRQAT
jgi:peptide chain release factor 3